ncbi:hypothetical protein Trydic_g20515 [Trypoxylus dichotomus]
METYIKNSAHVIEKVKDVKEEKNDALVNVKSLFKNIPIEESDTMDLIICAINIPNTCRNDIRISWSPNHCIDISVMRRLSHTKIRHILIHHAHHQNNFCEDLESMFIVVACRLL